MELEDREERRCADNTENNMYGQVYLDGSMKRNSVLEVRGEGTIVREYVCVIRGTLCEAFNDEQV